jgi:DNA mismatch repair protein MutS
LLVTKNQQDEFIEKLSPLYKLYFQLQQKYPNYIICCQIGDFYEIMGYDFFLINQAKNAHKKAGIQLTSKDKKKDSVPDMCGFPIHSAEGYFQKLVNAGETIVVVTQKINGTSTDKNKKVDRYIEKILSPGTIVENLSEEKSNYFACIYEVDFVVGVSLIDLSTGEVKISEIKKEELNDYLDKVNPSEILICGTLELKNNRFKLIHKKEKVKIKNLEASGKILAHVYDLKSPTSNNEYFVETLGLSRWLFGTLALSNLINYLSEETENYYYNTLLKKLGRPKVFNQINHLNIPLNGLKSLEILESQLYNKKDSLVYNLDKCKTAMGRRKIREWLQEPLVDIQEISNRHDIVENYIINNTNYSELEDIYDISRIARRIFLERLTPQEMRGMYYSLKNSESILLKENKELFFLEDILTYLEESIDIEKLPTYPCEEYNFFKNTLLEKVLKEKENWKKSYNDLIILKEKYNKISELEGGKPFGEIISTKKTFQLKGPKSSYELLKGKIKLKKLTSNTEIVEQEWENAATKCFAEMIRFKNKALKTWKEFQREFSDKFGSYLLEISEEIAQIDVLLNFAKISEERDYSRPEMINSEHAFFDLKKIRHPVVELNDSLEEPFVPNDVSLNEKDDIITIYGANSSGKSTLLKSVALNIIMAQIGCFIPSKEGSKLTPFKSILTRMTTYDSLSEGLSTFTMEMKELQIALKYTKEKSLFLLDEIGRGTSVEDGEAIAYATLEYLSSKENKGVAFFATHYHNLVDEIKKLENVSIKHLDCHIDDNGKLQFSREIKDGAGSGSYGIDVADSCGLPKSLIRVAKNYNKKYAGLKFSHYNNKVMGIICPLCESEEVQETHHKINQKQGRVKAVVINGVRKNINHKNNLIMICGSCHNKITNKEMQLIREEMNE